MRFLTGAVGEGLRGLHHPLLGLMLQPGNGLRSQVSEWSFHAADNGCFAQGEGFDPEVWLAWLADVPREGCLFATAPDVYADAAATWVRSEPYLDHLRVRGFRPALVAQDGFDQYAVDWTRFDVLFIGGTVEWKHSLGFEAAGAARARGKAVHVGRIASWKRYRGWSGVAESCDGTFVKYGPSRRSPELVGWLDRLLREPQLSLTHD